MSSEPKANGVSSANSSHQGRQKSASYPGFTLRQAEELANVVFKLGPRNCDQERVAQTAGYRTTKSSSFLRLKATASQFELVQVEKNGGLSVSDEWIEVFHNSEDLQLLRKARRKAILRPKLYKQLIEEYTDRQLPQLEKLSRELYINQKYSILKEAAGAAARIFLESASYAGLLNEKGYLVNVDNDDISVEQEDTQQEVEEEVTTQQEVARPTEPETSQQSRNNSSTELPSNLEGLEKYEITLINRKKAYLYVPVPLPYGEKKRLQQYIDLILEEPPAPSPSLRNFSDLSKEDVWSTETDF